MQKKIMQYYYQAKTTQEAAEVARAIAPLDGCLCANFYVDNSVEAFFPAPEDITRKKLFDGYRLLPAPAYLPGEQLLLTKQLTPLGGGYNTVFIRTISYVGKDTYRYYVEETTRKMKGWVNEQDLLPASIEA